MALNQGYVLLVVPYFLYFADTIARQDWTEPSDNLLLVGLV